MALPRIAVPTFTATLPSSKREVQFRPFMVKEEKVLLIAMESKDPDHMQRAMIDVISGCILDEDIRIDKLPSFDVEYLFLKIRSKSVSEKVTLSYRHVDGINYKGETCDALTNVEINLDDIEVKFREDHKQIIPLTDKLMMKMRYPTISDVKASIAEGSDELDLVTRCVESVYDDDDVFEPDSLEDARQFIGSLSNKQFIDIMKFFETMPTVEHTITYKCSGCGQEDTITLRGLSDFF